MKKLSLILTFLLLAGCQSTSTESEPAPYYSGDIVEIDGEQLDQYWIQERTEIKRLKGRPDWLPQGAGQWTVETTIDSNGNEVERTLISSQPEGFMTQDMVDKMPRSTFRPADTNPDRLPVQFTGTARIAPRSEL